MGLLQNETRIVEAPENNKTNAINIKSLSGYDAIGEKPESNTLTV